MATPDHSYTLSQYAHDGLATLIGRTPSRATTSRRGPQFTVAPNGAIAPTLDRTPQHHEGLSFALRELAIEFNYEDWTPAPNTHVDPPSYYTLFDKDYAKAVAEDDRSYKELPQWEKQERDKQLALRRFTDTLRPHYYNPSPKHAQQHTEPAVYYQSAPSRYSLSLPPFVREYYAALLAYHRIPLPVGTRHPNNLTTHVSACLEAIGSGHLRPPDDYLKYTTKINPRKRRIASESRARRLYGNFAGTPYLRAKDDKWRPIPPLNTPDAYLQYTQDDIDACYKQDLRDIAQEVLQLRPDLHEPDANITAPWPSRPIAPPPVRRAEITATGALKRRIEQATSSTSQNTMPQYLYKGRDITGAVDEALQAAPRAHPAIAAEWGIPLYMLKRLATRERVRQEIASHGND